MYSTKRLEKTAVDGIMHLPTELSMAHSMLLRDELEASITGSTAALENVGSTWDNLQDTIITFDIISKAQAERKQEIYSEFTYILDCNVDKVLQSLQDSKELVYELRQQIERLERQVVSLMNNYINFLDMYYGGQ